MEMNKTDELSPTIELSHQSGWTSIGETYVRGAIFVENQLLREQEFAARIANIQTKSTLKSVLEDSTGQYAIIHKTEDGWHIAVDHIRSWPIYYTTGPELVISDSSTAAHDSSSENNYDSLAASEYLFTSYVNGRDTLSKNVQQAEPGELITFQDQAANTIVRENYFTYGSEKQAKNGVFEELDDLFNDVFQRLIEYADGRPIILPLTGGYDSRLIALKLADLGYEDIVAYTSAPEDGSDDLEKAKQVAEVLGFNHVHLQIEKNDYRGFYTSGQWKIFQESIGFLGELPKMNSRFLKRALSTHPKIPDTGVLVPGHHALGGASKLPRLVGKQSRLSIDEFLHYIWKYSYARWRIDPLRSEEREIERLLQDRIISQLPGDLYQGQKIESTNKAIRGIESYYWRNRLPKYFLVHYEQESWEYDHWHPLLDKAYFEYLDKIDWKEKVDKKIQKDYVKTLHANQFSHNGSLHDDFVSSSGATFTEGLAQSLKNHIWDRSARLFARSPKPIEYLLKSVYYSTYGRPSDYNSKKEFRLVSERLFNQMNLRVAHRRPLQLLMLHNDGLFSVENVFIDEALKGVERNEGKS